MPALRGMPRSARFSETGGFNWGKDGKRSYGEAQSGTCQQQKRRRLWLPGAGDAAAASGPRGSPARSLRVTDERGGRIHAGENRRGATRPQRHARNPAPGRWRCPMLSATVHGRLPERKIHFFGGRLAQAHRFQQFVVRVQYGQCAIAGVGHEHPPRQR